jgi:hypothetical protein
MEERKEVVVDLTWEKVEVEVILMISGCLGKDR